MESLDDVSDIKTGVPPWQTQMTEDKLEPFLSVHFGLR